MQQFNDGDYVYSPMDGTGLYVLQELESPYDNLTLAVVGVSDGKTVRYVNCKGTLYSIAPMPAIVEANEINRLALNTIYGLEFEFCNSLHRALKDTPVVCYVSDMEKYPDIKDIVALVTSYSEQGYHTANGHVWKYATGIAKAQGRL